MEKKRYKMYKKGKGWVIVPIIFFGIISAECFLQDNTVYANEVIQVNQNDNNNGDRQNDLDIVSDDKTSSEISRNDLSKVENNNNKEPELDKTETTNDNENLEKNEQDGTINNETNENNKEEDNSTSHNSDSEKNIPDETENTNQPVQDTTDNVQSKKDTNNDNGQQSSKNESLESKNDNNVNIENSENSNIVSNQNNTKTDNKVNLANKDKSSKPEVKKESTASNQVTNFSKAANTQVIIPIYRVYNPNSGEHLHTMNSNEKDFLVKKGWRYEGISMRVTNSGQNLLRIYNPNSGEHHYTLNINEINMLKRAGWRYEGIAWQTPLTGLPMYRVFNPNSRGAGSHHYTLLKSERDSLLKKGWRNEGISWYTVSGPSPIQLNFLGINSQYIVNELSKHVNDRYYLGTPYKGLSSNDATQFMKPGTSMNCTGFVAKVIQNAGGNLNKITSISNNWGGAANAYNWRNALNNNVVSYTFNTVADLLKSGKAKKGDILYFEPNYNVTNYDCHIGVFWGNSSSENKIWHSVPSVNKISTIYAPSGFSKIIVYSM